MSWTVGRNTNPPKLRAESGGRVAPRTVQGALGLDQDQAIGSSGTISSATMLMILISGLTAGPAVSL